MVEELSRIEERRTRALCWEHPEQENHSGWSRGSQENRAGNEMESSSNEIIEHTEPVAMGKTLGTFCAMEATGSF